jgi:NADH dehydrogenase
VERVTGDIRRPADLERSLAGIHVVVSCVQGMVGTDVSPASVDRDGNLALVRAAARAGADVVLVSLTHAAADHPLEVARMKYAAEQALAAGEVPATVVRSAAFTELWADIILQSAGRGHRPTVLGRADRPIWWVSVEDVAEATVRAVVDPAYRGRTLDVVGPDGLTLVELARAVMETRGWPGSPRRVPAPVVRAAAATVGRLKPSLGRLLSAAIGMDDLPPDEPAATRRDFPGLEPASVPSVLASGQAG